jgi:hypothetical protein
MTNMNRNVNAIILVSRTSDRVLQAMGVRLRVTVLLLLEGQKVVSSDTLENVGCSGLLARFNDSSDGNLVLLHKRRGRDRVVTRLNLQQAFHHQREGNLIPGFSL